MVQPLQDLGRLIRRLFRLARWASVVFLAFFLLWAGSRVAEVYRGAHAIHPLFGAAFLAVFTLALVLLVGRPLYRFFRLPRALKPPRLPERAERTPRHLVRHLHFVERYVAGLLRNPEWSGSPEQVERVLSTCRALRHEARAAAPGGLQALEDRVADLEHGEVAALLQPLDRKASDVIRAEALKVGVATAVSPYGNLDAFLVLWRNANLVSALARIYYGRPGPRGTLRILSDVAATTFASAYLQDLSELAADSVASLAGKTAGVLAGPLLDGSLNAVATLRIGYLAKARCRSFSAWTARTRVQATRAALAEAGRLSRGVVADLVRTVGGGLLRLPARVVGGMLDRIGSLFRRPDAQPGT